MFRGQARTEIDSKHRLQITPHFKKLLSEQAGGDVVMTIDIQERCLLLFPMQAWEQLESSLGNLPDFSPSAKRVQRLMLGYANELEMDRYGRVPMPPMLQEYAGLNEDVVLVGQGGNIEIWGQAQWHLNCDKWLSGDEAETTNGAMDMMPMGL